ncbi:hypothetical protein C8F01DRAFT_1143782, partial [Mycena amicta]
MLGRTAPRRRSVFESRPRVFLRTACLTLLLPNDKPTYTDPLLSYSRFRRLRLQRVRRGLPMEGVRVGWRFGASISRWDPPEGVRTSIRIPSGPSLSFRPELAAGPVQWRQPGLDGSPSCDSYTFPTLPIHRAATASSSPSVSRPFWRLVCWE